MLSDVRRNALQGMQYKKWQQLQLQNSSSDLNSAGNATIISLPKHFHTSSHFNSGDSDDSHIYSVILTTYMWPQQLSCDI